MPLFYDFLFCLSTLYLFALRFVFLIMQMLLVYKLMGKALFEHMKTWKAQVPHAKHKRHKRAHKMGTNSPHTPLPRCVSTLATLCIWEALFFFFFLFFFYLLLVCSTVKFPTSSEVLPPEVAHSSNYLWTSTLHWFLILQLSETQLSNKFHKFLFKSFNEEHVE